MVLGGGLGPRIVTTTSSASREGRMKPTPPHAPSLLNRTCCRTQPNWLHSEPHASLPGRVFPGTPNTGATGPRLRSWGPPGPEATSCHVRRCTPKPKRYLTAWVGTLESILNRQHPSTFQLFCHARTAAAGGESFNQFVRGDTNEDDDADDSKLQFGRHAENVNRVVQDLDDGGADHDA